MLITFVTVDGEGPARKKFQKSIKYEGGNKKEKNLQKF